ncbi:MAG TPA: phosphate regulon transcriptional regulator PhoB [Casimicrobium huifangae]|jgi:two-component system phosphate regulon response regulator PhoB|nr:phosphate regulon transcriptional regulator PhoB [Casimicrobium huifangae]HQA34837.1 phosphate regulon transcriptional regulator PhoB [Casimicrobium huifangae]HQD65338.1 phosphate regulon transcriptional regulator PhoB [Casimicrobium huifangae]
MPATILIVEDEPAIAELVSLHCRHAGYTVKVAHAVLDARDIVDETLPDLVVLDWMLPDKSGIDFARELRRDERTRDLPILMLTARAAEDDKVRGLEVGADDYVTKPFSPKELVARIKALLRRAAPDVSEEPLEVAGLRLEPASHRVTGDGLELKVGPTEFRLLRFFMARPERVMTRQALLDGVWGDHVFIEERTVDVHVRRLRLALEPSGHDALVETVRGGGYRLRKQPLR